MFPVQVLFLRLMVFVAGGRSERAAPTRVWEWAAVCVRRDGCVAARAGAGWASYLLSRGFVSGRAGLAKARDVLFETMQRVRDEVGSGSVDSGGGVIEYSEQVVG